MEPAADEAETWQARCSGQKLSPSSASARGSLVSLVQTQPPALDPSKLNLAGKQRLCRIEVVHGCNLSVRWGNLVFVTDSAAVQMSRTQGRLRPSREGLLSLEPKPYLP